MVVVNHERSFTCNRRWNLKLQDRHGRAPNPHPPRHAPTHIKDRQRDRIQLHLRQKAYEALGGGRPDRQLSIRQEKTIQNKHSQRANHRVKILHRSLEQPKKPAKRALALATTSSPSRIHLCRELPLGLRSFQDHPWINGVLPSEGYVFWGPWCMLGSKTGLRLL